VSDDGRLQLRLASNATGEPLKLDRRTFLKLIAVLAVAVAGGSWLWFLSQTPEPPAGSTTANTAPATTSTSEASGFPVAWNVQKPPATNATDYRLKIDGEVPKPLEFTLAELYAMPSTQKVINIQCVEGWDADVKWEGILLTDLLSRAGVSPKNLAQVTIEDTIGYKVTLTAGEVTNWDTMIALKSGGAPLTFDHGYPARLVAPTQIGTFWIKCVGRITCKGK
jgi:DMSO/TMAO reductase YedYZ molybdopterin-dependent catalytic subunit